MPIFNEALECFRGAACRIDFQIEDPTTGEPKDITGWTLRAVLRDSDDPDDDDLAVGSVTVTSATTGAGHIIFASDDMDQPAGIYTVTLGRTDAGAEDVLGYGPFAIRTPRVPLLG